MTVKSDPGQHEYPETWPNLVNPGRANLAAELYNRIHHALTKAGWQEAVQDRSSGSWNWTHPEHSGSYAMDAAYARLYQTNQETRVQELESVDREALGMTVREEWIAWQLEQIPKPSWFRPWSDRSELDREVDRRIGERLYRMGRDRARACPGYDVAVPGIVDREALGKSLCEAFGLGWPDISERHREKHRTEAERLYRMGLAAAKEPDETAAIARQGGGATDKKKMTPGEAAEAEYRIAQAAREAGQGPVDRAETAEERECNGLAADLAVATQETRVQELEAAMEDLKGQLQKSEAILTSEDTAFWKAVYIRAVPSSAETKSISRLAFLTANLAVHNLKEYRLQVVREVMES